MSVCLCLSVSQSVSLSVCLSLSQSVCLSVCLSVSLSLSPHSLFQIKSLSQPNPSLSPPPPPSTTALTTSPPFFSFPNPFYIFVVRSRKMISSIWKWSSIMNRFCSSFVMVFQQPFVFVCDIFSVNIYCGLVYHFNVLQDQRSVSSKLVHCFTSNIRVPLWCDISSKYDASSAVMTNHTHFQKQYVLCQNIVFFEHDGYFSVIVLF